MKSNIIELNGTNEDIQCVQAEVGKVATYETLEKKEVLRLSLLAEELLGVEKGIMGFSFGEFWVESTAKEFKLKLKAKVELDPDLIDQFLRVSKSGTNEYTKSFGGKLKFIINWMLNAQYNAIPVSTPGGDFLYQPCIMASGLETAYEYSWSLAHEKAEANEESEIWDELEMSVLGSLADDVMVSAGNNTVEITVVKNF